MKTYKVWRIINYPNRIQSYYEVDSPVAGAIKIIELAKKDLEDPNVETNVFGLIETDGVEEQEWYDENGDDIDVMVDEMWDEVDI